MKFARYLDETLIPEWKKAYINYRGLKKIITAIQSQEESELPLLPSDSSTSRYEGQTPGITEPPPSHAHAKAKGYGSLGTTPPMRPRRPPEPSPTELPALNMDDHRVSRAEGQNDRRTAPQTSGASTKSAASLRRRLSSWRPISMKSGSLRTAAVTQPSGLSDLLNALTPLERQFFDALDRELDKVENFYTQREKEATSRAEQLKEQLHELAAHRKAYYEAHPGDKPHWPGYDTVHAIGEAISVLGIPIQHTEAPGGLQHLHPSTTRTTTRDSYDPEEYRHAQKKLKKALREYYRGLELLDNYRILNLTGFRKALKKFEKVTKIRFAQVYYMDEKVEPCAFASQHILNDLREDVEATYAARFEKGDRKAAKEKLRADATPKSHHFSMFRSGAYIGLGVPPLIMGIVQSFDPSVRERIPNWGPLLQLYSALIIPPLFAFLIGLNIVAWTRNHINWVFIFELDVRASVNYRQYFELPSFMLMTLCFAFWLSFSGWGTSTVSPTTWPLAWVVFAVFMLINPLPIFYPHSRIWFVKTAGKLLVSGTSRVDFADFWMGDQFCSLVYTMSNLYVLGCAYDNDWNNVYGVCNPANSWVPAFLSALPGLLRLVQCIKRWADSGLKIHVLNAGKYASTSITYALYWYWRHLGGTRDFSFVLWCLFSTIGSTYTSAWDLLMDWSVLRPHADHKFLREELIYPYTPTYYFGIASNVIIRFIWIWYIPSGGLNQAVRGFIFAILEVLRRWQWNFYRVENEHIGNADRYRVTREIPLPYTLDEDDRKDGDLSDEEAPAPSSASAKSRPWATPVNMRSVRRLSTGLSLEGGAHGPREARDYDRDQPDDRAALSSLTGHST